MRSVPIATPETLGQIGHGHHRLARPVVGHQGIGIWHRNDDMFGVAHARPIDGTGPGIPTHAKHILAIIEFPHVARVGHSK